MRPRWRSISGRGSARFQGDQPAGGHDAASGHRHRRRADHRAACGAPASGPASSRPKLPPAFDAPTSPIRTIIVDPGPWRRGRRRQGRGRREGKRPGVERRAPRESVIEGRLGIRVLLTRDDDRNVPIDERTAIANNNKADLFISLHANAIDAKDDSGATIFTAAFDARRAGRPRGRRRRARADIRRRPARHRARTVGPRADASSRSVECVRRHARAAMRDRDPAGEPSGSTPRRCACSNRRTCRRCWSRWGI